MNMNTQLPQPGDYCQHNEFDGEVIECDGRAVYIELLDGEYEGQQVCVPYIPNNWI